MYSEIYFGKEKLEDIFKEDVEHFFSTERKETNKIEFKSYIDVSGKGTKNERDKEKIETVIKTICAFLNSDGGLLIWGSPKGQRSTDESETEKVFNGELTGVEVQLEKDQFISKISDEISPTPNRILFSRIVLSSGKYCYLIDVTKSDFAPHQYKGTYYMRLDGSSRAAPHHYVEALMKKVSYPRLACSLSFGTTRQFSSVFGMPLIVNIVNYSTAIHDKNVQYRLICTGGGIHRLKGFQINNETRDTELISDPRPVIHHSMPTGDEFYFFGDRHKANLRTGLDVTILLTIWGELSPALISEYKIHFAYNPQSGQIDSHIQKRENVYLHENSVNGQSEFEKIEKAKEMHLQMYEQRLINSHSQFFQFVQ